MKKKILLLMCGLAFCGSIFASGAHTVENMPLIEKTQETPVLDYSIICKYSQQFSRPGLRDEFETLIEYFAKNPNELKNVFDEQFSRCSVFSQKEDSLQATLFEQAVKIKMLEAGNESLLRSIRALSHQMSLLPDQNVVKRLSGVERIVGDLQGTVKKQNETIGELRLGIESRERIIAEQNEFIIELQEKVKNQDKQNKTIVDQQESITSIMGKLAALAAKRSEKLEGGTKTPEAPSVAIPEDWPQSIYSKNMAINQLPQTKDFPSEIADISAVIELLDKKFSRELENKVDKEIFVKFKNFVLALLEWTGARDGEKLESKFSKLFTKHSLKSGK